MLTVHSFLQSLRQSRMNKEGKRRTGPCGRPFARVCSLFLTGAASVTVVATAAACLIGHSPSRPITAYAKTHGGPGTVRESGRDFADAGFGPVTVEDMAQKMRSDRYTGYSQAGPASMIRSPEELLAGYAVTGGLVLREEQARQTAKALAGEHLEEAREEIRLAPERAEEEAREQERMRAKQARPASAVAYSQEDYQVLLEIVQAEAGVCDEKGKILVANVILNRVRSGEFPDTITGVVYEPEQFSPVRDGSLGASRVTGETVECVDRALAGEDYSQGALYFMNRSGSRSRAVTWFDTHLTYLFRHDGHEFFK